MEDTDRRYMERMMVLQQALHQQQQQQQPRQENSDIPPELRAYYAIAELAFTVISVPIEVLSRRQFGERYLGAKRVIFGALAYGFIVWFIALWNGEQNRTVECCNWYGGRYWSQPDPDLPNLMVFFGIVSGAAALYNLWLIQQRKRERVTWHTKSTGISWLQGRLPGNDWTLYRFWEPGLWLLVAGFFLLANKPFGLYLLAASLTLLLRNNQNYARHLTAYQDLNDIAIEAEHRSGQMAHLGKVATAGFSPVEIPPELFDVEQYQREMASRQVLSGKVKPAPPADGWEDIDDTVRDVLGNVRQKLRPSVALTVAQTAAPIEVAGEPPAAPAVVPAAASPPASPPRTPVWHQAMDWPDPGDEGEDFRQGESTRLTA